jgi:hypothetical protein
MGNTPNNNFPFPESTDLVKDGAQAIEDLADAIDTTLGVYAPVSSGLTLINTTSFSGVSSQSVNDVFSSTYKKYVVVLDATFASSANINFRYRVAGSDDSTSNYNYQNLESSNTANNGERQTGQNISVLSFRNGDRFTGQLNLFNPFETSKTQLTSLFSMIQTNTPYTMINSAVFGATTSFTGFTLIASASTFTGSINVFGVAE